MITLIKTILGFVLGHFTQGSTPTERAASSFNGIALVGGIVAFLTWLVGPGQEWQIQVSASFACLFMACCLLLGYVAGEILRRMSPPSQ